MSKPIIWMMLLVSFSFVIVTSSNAARTTTDLIALYTLDEGSGTTIFDTSGAAPAIDLTNTTPAATAWIAGGLRSNTTTAVSNESAATKLISACMASNELTLEAWVQPLNVTQTGPARIVTNSLNYMERNFTLGVDLDQFVFRIRTTETSLNGTPSFRTQTGTVTTNLTHIVCTREASGDVTVYVDSISVSTTSIGGDFSNWNTNYGLAFFNEVTLEDRLWLGDLHLVAIYSRALSGAEVADNFSAGANPLIPTVTFSPTTTPTTTVSATSTPSPSVTLTPTESATYTVTLTPTATLTTSATITLTATISPTPTVTPTASTTPTVSPVQTATVITNPDLSDDVVAGPVPARGNTLYFSYKLPEAGIAYNTIYNVAGEKVKLIRKEHPQSGLGQMQWDISNVAPGIYMYKFKLELIDGTKTDLPLKKVIVIKTK